jgi:hypothetical protein
MNEKRWHGSVGYTLTDSNGVYCGYVGRAYPCVSQEDGWRQGIEWLHCQGKSTRFYLIHTYEIKVNYY